LAVVKMMPCVFCDSPPPNEAHHPYQGLHYLTVAACKSCHSNRVWRLGGITEAEAINETLRRMDNCEQGIPVLAGPHPYNRQKSTRTPTKIIPRSV
jgi:hypothetical protein